MVTFSFDGFSFTPFEFLSFDDRLNLIPFYFDIFSIFVLISYPNGILTLTSVDSLTFLFFPSASFSFSTFAFLSSFPTFWWVYKNFDKFLFLLTSFDPVGTEYGRSYLFWMFWWLLTDSVCWSCLELLLLSSMLNLYLWIFWNFKNLNLI